MIQAHVWNVGTCVAMLREPHKWEDPISARVPMRDIGAEQPVVVRKVL